MASRLPLADARALRPVARTTLAVTALLAAAAAGVTIAFLVTSRTTHTQSVVPLPARASTILVLDLSASISSDTFSRIGGTLAALARSHGRFGLVVFSDEAYEALPPGTPARDLAPLVRYFTLPVQKQPGFAPSFPANPWAQTFTAGTRISAGLALAHTLAVEQSPRPQVVLVSDLDDGPSDVDALGAVFAAYARDRVPVRIVGLNPSPDDVALFRRLVPAVTVTQAPTLAQVPPHDRTPFPWTLVALVLAAAAALAVSLAWAPRLAWRTT